MTGRPPRSAVDELALARISAAAGRARIGRRLATYPGAPRAVRPRPAVRAGWRAGVTLAGVVTAVVWRAEAAARAAATTVAVVAFGSLALVLLDRRAERPGARLDLYERGLTVLHGGRIRVVRYDATSVLRAGCAYTLTDVDGDPVVLRGDPSGTRPDGFGGVEEWGPRIERAVGDARPPPDTRRGRRSGQADARVERWRRRRRRLTRRAARRADDPPTARAVR